MHFNVRIKFWFFEHYWWLLIFSAIITITTLLHINEQIATIATVIGAILSIAYFLQKQKLEELRVFREIFKECNARYDNMNEALESIGKKKINELTPNDKSQIIDYLNLCGEEYLYFKRGYIDPGVWYAWHNGMKSVVSAPSIRSVWEIEQKSSSYYDLPL